MSRSLRTTLVALLAVSAVGLLLYRSRDWIGLEGFSWQRLAEAVGQARWDLLLLSLLTIFAAYALRAERWRRFSRHLGPSTFGSIYSATLVGFTALFLLGRAGEPVRPILIARKERQPVSSLFGIYVLERLFDVASTAVLAGVALALLPRAALDAGQSAALVAAVRTSGALLMLGSVGAVGFLVYFRLHGARWLEPRLERWRAGAGWRARLAGMFAGFSEGLQGIRTARDLAAALGYTAAHWLLVALIYYWVAESFGGRLAELGFTAAVLVLAFTMVGSMLQLPGVGGGAQLASFLAYTVIFGVDKEPAAAAAITLWLITFAGVSLAGVPLLLREGWSMAELRRLARAEAEAGARGGHVTLPGLEKDLEKPMEKLER